MLVRNIEPLKAPTGRPNAGDEQRTYVLEVFMISRLVLYGLFSGVLVASAFLVTGCAATRSTMVQAPALMRNDGARAPANTSDGLKQARIWFGDENLGR